MGDATEPTVVMSDVTKTFTSRRGPTVTALDSISLEVRSGEIMGLLGPNGAGKSTVVGVLSSLVVPDRGTVRVAGTDVVADGATARERIGVALQETGIDPAQSARTLLVLHARLYGFGARAARARAAELSERFDLGEVFDRKIGTYSGGIRRRLDLALALVHRPSVLFLDEPTTGLDITTRRELWEEVRQLRSEGAAVLLTTQYLEEADVLADRVAIIQNGAVVRSGTPAELKQDLREDVIELRFGDAEDAAKAAGILDTPNLPDSETTIRVSVDNAAGQVSAIVTTLVSGGLRPTQVNLTSPTLDDVFLTIVGNQDASEAGLS